MMHLELTMGNVWGITRTFPALVSCHGLTRGNYSNFGARDTLERIISLKPEAYTAFKHCNRLDQDCFVFIFLETVQ